MATKKGLTQEGEGGSVGAGSPLALTRSGITRSTCLPWLQAIALDLSSH